jgi:hypothetical protein
VTPTRRSLEYLRDQGYVCQIVERWNSFARVRVDLFGFVDIVAIKAGQTLAVQTTSSDNVSKRVAKIAESEYLPALRSANWSVHVHGWRKNAAGKWVLRIEDLS